jgi:hypothetical protein
MNKNSTVPILYVGGSYGTFVEWCLMYFSGKIEYFPFQENGNSHEYQGNMVSDINGWRNYSESDTILPVVRLHPKTQEFESITDNIDEVLKSVDRAILIYANDDLFLLTVNNKFEKIFPEGYLAHCEDFIKDRFPFWGAESLKDMAPWQIREFLSFYIRPQHMAESGILELQEYHNPRLLKVNINDLIKNFRKTIENLLQYCGLPANRDNFEQVYCKWIALQRHIDKDRITNNIIKHVVDDKELDWSGVNLTIIDEAYIQWALRSLHSLDIKCYNLNVFPTNTSDLRKLLVNVDKTI